MTDSEAANLQRPPVSNEAALRLADFYGICLQDGVGLEKWLRVVADRGDPAAMKNLASIIERQLGRASEGTQLRKTAAEIERRSAARPAG